MKEKDKGEIVLEIIKAIAKIGDKYKLSPYFIIGALEECKYLLQSKGRRKAMETELE